MNQIRKAARAWVPYQDPTSWNRGSKQVHSHPPLRFASRAAPLGTSTQTLAGPTTVSDDQFNSYGILCPMGHDGLNMQRRPKNRVRLTIPNIQNSSVVEDRVCGKSVVSLNLRHTSETQSEIM